MKPSVGRRSGEWNSEWEGDNEKGRKLHGKVDPQVVYPGCRYLDFGCVGVKKNDRKGAYLLRSVMSAQSHASRVLNQNQEGHLAKA